MVAEIADVWVLHVLIPRLLLHVPLVRKVNHCVVLYVLCLRSADEMRGVTAVRVVTHQMPDNKRQEPAVIVWDEFGDVPLPCKQPH